MAELAEFQYKTGQEIVKHREELKKALYESRYEIARTETIANIDFLWKMNDVENSLIQYGVANIKFCESEALKVDYSDYIREERERQKELTLLHKLEKLIRREFNTIQIGCYSLFDFFPLTDITVQRVMSGFGFDDPVIFNELMNEYGFDWDLKLEVTGLSTVLFSKKYIHKYNWALEIKLKTEN